jgi:acetolactate synthase-1/2/3 large subunit
MISGGEAIISVLQAHGVDVVFGIPGGHNLAVYGALVKSRAIRHVLGRHEQGLVYMADGYSRASGRIGVVLATSGPAVANMASAMGGVTTDHSSVLAVASTVRSDLVGKDRGGLHDLGMSVDIMLPVCRATRNCLRVDEISEALGSLFERLKNGRPGGAYCEIPLDVMNAEADVSAPRPAPRSRVTPDVSSVAAAVRLLSGATRPVVWTGAGAILSNASEEVESLATRIGAVVTTSTLGRGILPGDRDNVIFADGIRWGQLEQVIADADVVLAVGTMFKEEDTAAWTIKPGKKLIHVDIDREQIGRSYPADVKLVGDAKAALQSILAGLGSERSNHDEWILRCQQAYQDNIESRRQSHPMEMEFLDTFRSVLPREAVVFFDRCNLGYWAWRCMEAYGPRTFHYSFGYGGLGGSLPQAIGGKIACPEKKIVSVIGDGGFQFTGMDLIVAVQEQLPITIVLCNNNRYGAIAAGMTKRFGEAKVGVALKNPDFQRFCSAYGVSAVRVNKVEEFGETLAAGIASDSLNLIELTADLADPP